MVLNRGILDNQLANLDTNGLMQRSALVALAVVLAIALAIFGVRSLQVSDPYIQHVLTLEGDPIQGEAIFQMNCAGCHGANADGLVGPSLHRVSDRKSRVSLIRQVTGGNTPPMPQFQPSPQEMADLLRYLETL